MPIRRLLCCLFVLPVLAHADANDGEFMGYKLGAEYPTSPSVVEVTTTGNLLIEAENPVKPSDIVRVSLVATPDSKTIGYIVAASWYETENEAREAGRRYAELLRAKYSDWDLGREAMDANLRIVEVNFDKAPHTLQLSLGRDEIDGRSMWRMSMGLGWLRESSEWRAWQQQAATEQSTAKATEDERLVEEADVRGL